MNRSISQLARLGIGLALLGLMALVPRFATANAAPPGGGKCTSGNGVTVCSQTLPLDSGVYDNGISCGSFDIYEHDIGTTKEVDRFDKSGNPIDISFDVLTPFSAGSTISNSPLTTGTSIPIKGEYHLKLTNFDPVSGNFQDYEQSGMFYNATLPGNGLVFHFGGHRAVGPNGLVQQSFLLFHENAASQWGSACIALS